MVTWVSSFLPILSLVFLARESSGTEPLTLAPPSNRNYPVSTMASGLMGQINQTTTDGSADTAYLARYNAMQYLTTKLQPLVDNQTNLTSIESQLNDLLNSENPTIQKLAFALSADLPTGGLVARAGDLQTRLVQVQKDMQTNVNKAISNINGQTLAGRQQVNVMQADYQSQIQAQVNAVNALLKSMNQQMAFQASQIAQATQATALSIAAQSASDSSKVGAQVGKTQQSLDDAADTINKGLDDATSAVSDANDAVDAVTQTAKDTAAGVVQDAQGQISTTSTKSTQAITDAAGSATSQIQDGYTQLGNQVGSSLNAQSGILSQQLTNVTSAGTAQVRSLNGTISSTQQTMSAAVGEAGRTANGWVASADSNAQQLVGDAQQSLNDQSSLVANQQSVTNGLSTDGTTQAASVQAAVQSQFAALLASITGKLSGQGGDALGVISDQQGGTGSVMNLLMTLLSSKSASVNANLAKATNAAAGNSGQLGSSISKTQSTLSSSIQAAQANANLQGQQGTATLNAASSGISAGASDVSDGVAGAANANAAALSGIVNGVTGSSQSKFAALAALLGTNSDSWNSQLQNLVSGSMTTSSQGVSSDMSQIATVLAALSGSLSDTTDGMSSVYDQMHGMTSQQQGFASGFSTQLDSFLSGSQASSQALGASGDQALATLTNLLQASISNTTSNVSDSANVQMAQLLSSIASLSSTANQTSGEVGASLSASGQAVSNLLGSFGHTSSQLNQQMGSLGSYVQSLLSSFGAQRTEDINSESDLIGSKFTNLLAEMKSAADQAGNNTATQVSSRLGALSNNEAQLRDYISSIQQLMSDSVAQGNNATSALSSSTSDIETGMSVAGNDAGQVQGSTSSAAAQLFEDVSNKVANANGFVNSSRASMQDGLTNISATITQAQQTLTSNVRMYDAQIDKVISQIQSYMNMSSAADAQAVAQNIASQLSQVSASATSAAASRASIADKVSSSNTQANSTTSAAQTANGGVIDAAMSVNYGAQAATTANVDSLVTAATTIDASSNAMQAVLNNSATAMVTSFAEDKAQAEQSMNNNEGAAQQSQTDLTSQASELAAQSNRNYMSNIARISGGSDDLVLTASQLAGLSSGAEGSITDSTTSVMNHMKVSVDTQAALNQASVRKVATINNVASAFQSVVNQFVNESIAAMDTNDQALNALADSSDTGLSLLNDRTGSQIQWLTQASQSSQSSLKLNVDQNSQLQNQLSGTASTLDGQLATVVTNEAADFQTLRDQATNITAELTQSNNGILSDVRQWVANYGQQVDAALTRGGAGASTASGSSFLQKIHRHSP